MFTAFANDGNLIFSLMIKTEIIGFCQNINRIVKLVELSDTLTQIFKAHMFLKILMMSHWKQISGLLTPRPPQKKTRLKINHILVQFPVSPQRLILRLLTQSGVWNYHITCIEFLIYNTAISYRLTKQNIFFKWRCNRLYNIFALASMQDDVI